RATACKNKAAEGQKAEFQLVHNQGSVKLRKAASPITWRDIGHDRKRQLGKRRLLPLCYQTTTNQAERGADCGRRWVCSLSNRPAHQKEEGMREDCPDAARDPWYTVRAVPFSMRHSGIGNSTYCATYTRATSDCPRAGEATRIASGPAYRDA